MKARHRWFGAGFIGSAAFLAAALPCTGAWSASDPADPTGVWLVKDGDARIQINRCPQPRSRICGYIVWTKDGGGTDTKNPDAAKRSRPVVGMQMLLGLEPDGDVYSGPIYNAENGKTYDAHIKLSDADHLTLKGCVLKYLCQSQTWTKVVDVAGGQLTGKIDGAGGPRTDNEWVQKAKTRVSKH